MTTKQPQSQTELSQHLKDHLGFLQASANAYDGGFAGEAKRLAVSIRVLVHDTNISKSLLGQLGQKSANFVDTAFPVEAGNLSSHTGLVMVSASPSGGARYMAFLDDAPHGQIRTVDFDSWWNTTVFIDARKNALSRKDLVLAVTNQDGGAHVDPALNQTYADLSRNNSLGWIFSDGKTTQPLEKPECAAIRQIAHELLKSQVVGYTKMPTYPSDVLAISGVVTVFNGAETLVQPAIMNVRKKKLGRNEPCSCGSCKKYKRCCGTAC